MNIVIIGGTGFVGSYLTKVLVDSGHKVQACGREVFADSYNLPGLVNQQDLLIMLSGANIGQRWSDKVKRELWSSRIETNRQLQAALEACDSPPKRVFAASAIGIYPQTDCAHPLDETCSKVGEGFLAELGQAWESETKKLSDNLVTFRFGVVLGQNGGALQKMLLPFKLGLGGPVAGGEQCFSWVHIHDLAAALQFAIEHPEMRGVFNLTSPHPVTNREFGKTLANVLHRPFLLPLPYWQLKLMFGEGAQVLTHSSAVLPTKLLAQGFEFEYADIEKALTDIVKN